MLLMLGTMTQDSGEDLEEQLLRIAAGDTEALAAFYNATRSAVYGLALSYLKNGHDTEDVVQDTYLRVWDSAPLYRPQGTPKAWLLKIARNLALMQIRQRDKTRELPEDLPLTVDGPAVTVEDRQVLEAAFQVLGDQERQIVMLHVTAGLKHRELAQLLELPLSTVLSKYRRALLKLKQRLEGGDAP